MSRQRSPAPGKPRLWRKSQSYLYNLHPPAIPAESARVGYTFGLGGIAILSALIATVTGALLMFYYEPNLERAYASLVLIDSVVHLGRFVRSLHFWSAQLLVVSVILHMARVVFTAGYRPPRRFNWLLGLGLLVLVLLWDFTGYVLRFDAEVIWALQVGTNLLKELPILGSTLYVMVVGGHLIGMDTVLRFYAWHVMGLTLAVGVGIVYHIWRIRVDGGISRPERRPGEKREFVNRDTLFFRELIAALLVSAGLVLLSTFAPPSLAGPGDLSQPEVSSAYAPWFFLAVQRLLHYLPPVWAGWVVPLAGLLLLGLLPFLDARGPGQGRWFARERWLPQLIFGALLGLILVLSLIEHISGA